MFFCILAGNAWGKRVYFTYTTVELSTSSMTTTTNPDNNSESCYMYQQDIYWLWYEGDNPINLGEVVFESGTVNVQDCGDFEWTVKVNGNIDIVCYDKKIDNNYTNDIYFLKSDDPKTTAWNATKYGSHIYFKDPSNGKAFKGTITVTATNKDFDGEPFTCSYTIRVNMDTKSIKWDFYSQPLTVANDGNWNDATYMGTEGSSPLVRTYKNPVSSSTDPLTIISGTNDLRFVAAEGKLGWYNDSENSGASGVRFIAIAKGAQLIIPSSIFSSYSHPKVRIKMGRYGGTTDDLAAHLTITNANDALGKEINSVYKIGGSDWWGTAQKKDYHQRGEYHFQIRNKSSDFTITMNDDGQSVPWLMLYTIEVYDSETMITENTVLGSSYQLLNKYGQPAATGTYNLHYRGKGENTKIEQVNTTGSVTVDLSSEGSTGGLFDHKDKATSHTYTSIPGQVGTFNIRISCYDHTGNYCTDYADRRQSVGYMESKSYPYTWDFTDIMAEDRHFAGGGRMDAGVDGEGWLQSKGWHLWAATDGIAKFGLRLALDAGHNVMYCGGSQLWYGKYIIPEAAGLAFTPVNYDNAYDYSLSLSADGLTFAQGNRDWWGWRVTVPAVPAGGAVYIHATKDRSDNFYGVKYYVGASVDNKTEMTPFEAGNVAGTGLKLANQIGGSSNGDNVVYAVCNQGGSAQDITLFFNGVTVHKMAVSTAPKTVNKYGWTTESRNQDIDPELTSYMTGQNFTNYLVTAADYAAKHVTMTPIANTNVIRAATADDSQDAYIIHNNAGTTVNIVNGGFHLFAPDMHESDDVSGEEEVRRKPYVDTSSNFLRAKLYATDLNDATTWIPATSTSSEGKYTNYAFTWRNWMLNADGKAYGDMIDGPQAFYRIAAQGAQSSGNQAYLPVLSERAAGARGFYMVFGEDEDPGSHGTAVEVVKNTVTKSDVYYNLNGQQLTGKPVKGGIYIHNGKKVVIK